MSGEKVMFGATVTIEDSESGDRKTYTIVGEHEASIKKGKISIDAPVARSLIGKSVGDTVTLKTPKGNRDVDVVSVEWNEVSGPDDEES
jgi:transcription elongation factor GreA